MRSHLLKKENWSHLTATGDINWQELHQSGLSSNRNCFYSFACFTNLYCCDSGSWVCCCNYLQMIFAAAWRCGELHFNLNNFTFQNQKERMRIQLGFKATVLTKLIWNKESQPCRVRHATGLVISWPESPSGVRAHQLERGLELILLFSTDQWSQPWGVLKRLVVTTCSPLGWIKRPVPAASDQLTEGFFSHSGQMNEQYLSYSLLYLIYSNLFIQVFKDLRLWLRKGAVTNFVHKVAAVSACPNGR